MHHLYIAAIYRPNAIFLPPSVSVYLHSQSVWVYLHSQSVSVYLHSQSVWVYLHSISLPLTELQKKLCKVRWCVMAVPGHRNWYQSKACMWFPFRLPSQLSDCLLSFLKCNDLRYWSKICIFLAISTHTCLVWSPHEGVPHDLGLW